jgi:hypothetical protein
MKPCLIAALLLGPFGWAAVQAGDPGAAGLSAPQPAPRAWLGIQIAKPDPSVTVHVPSLPQGIGFMVVSTDEGGPARQAGILEFDLLWKLGDQMLVNEAQLAALLRLSKPGDEVILSGFRGGKPLSVKLKLGEAPAKQKPFPDDVVDAAILPGDCGVPMRIVNVSQKSASFSADEGRAVVRHEGDGYLVKINGVKNEEIYAGQLASHDELDKIPEAWRRRVLVLCRTLDQTMEGGDAPERQPRPRVIPPVLSKP